MTERYYSAWDERVLWDTLPNGLTVAVVPRPGFRKKLCYFVTDYGAIHRDFILDGVKHTSPAGVAHYLEHKMFDLPRGEVSPEFAALGANPNAFTGYDLTAYYFSCTENFEKCLDLLLEFVSQPYFTEESVAKEQGIIGQEIDMTADAPDSKIFEQLMEAMYREHPVRTPILGDRESIGRITPQVLYDCHRAFYSPANMLLCVVGDVDGDEVVRLARQRLGDEKRPVPEKMPLPAEEMTCPQSLVTCQMEVASPMFQLGFKCEPAPRGEEAVRQEIVGDLAAEALFGESSELYLKLYEEGIIDSSFGGGFETVDGMCMLTASGDSDDPEAVRDAILAAVDRVIRDLDEASFLRMKRSALGRRIRELDSFDSTAFRICAYYFSGFDYFDFPEVFASVERSEVCEFLKKTVTQSRCCLSVIDPKEET
jgi:predicted Zn-dependent peptidase